MDKDRSKEDSAHSDQGYVTRAGWYWIGGMALLAAGSQLLASLNRSTTIFPDRVDAIYMAFVFGFVVAGISVVVGLNETRGSVWTKFTRGVLAFGSMGFLATFLLLGEVSNLVFARIDFPPEQTRTFQALLPIGRAYKTSKGRYSSTKFNYTIQPTPLWTNISIARKDWDFMLEGRLLDEDSDAIPSDGYFCARVQMQTAGNALRVLNAGHYALPEGSVELCPPQALGVPYLELNKSG